MNGEKQKWEGDGLGPEDMAIPEVKLIQNVGGSTAKEAGASPGDFYCSLTDEVIKGIDGFDMVIVVMQKNRTYWGRTDISNEPPECASLQVRRGGGTSLLGDDCSLCEHRNEAPWLLTTAERRVKCLLNYNILGINMDGLPILLRASGISSLPAKELYTQLTLNKILKKDWYKATTHVSSIPKKLAAGDAFALRFGKLQLIEDAVQLEEFKVQSNQMLGTQIALPEGRDEVEATPEVKPLPQRSIIIPEKQRTRTEPDLPTMDF